MEYIREKLSSLWPSSDVNIDTILPQLSREEKVSLLAAADWWRTPLIRREGKVLVPNIKTTDGPNGARGESYVNGVKSNCYPCGACVGASFDTDLAYNIAKHIAQEARAKASHVLLAPTINVVRSPLGGRNYETFSEDPWALGTMGAAYINGCQSERIGATVKHFVANDVEKRRRFLTAEIAQRPLREIYLYPFQVVVKQSDPWCFMTSYNKVNGTYCACDPWLLQTVLRDEWGYKGLVMSDWVATYTTNEAMNAGQDLEMPGPPKFRGERLLQAIKDGGVTEETVTTSAKRVLQLIKQSGGFEDPERQEPPEKTLAEPDRFEFIAQAAAECAVLLKNDGDVLPIKPKAKVVAIGNHALKPAVGGGGSARVFSVRTVSPLEGLEAAGLDVHYEPGVPVYNAVPFPEPEVLSAPAGVEPPSAKTPVKIEWYNGDKPGDSSRLVRTEYLETSQYMIKERWPANLDQAYCTRMTFTITPLSSGPHTLSVLTTGHAKLYLDEDPSSLSTTPIFTYEQRPTLEPESMYFFASQLERRFTQDMRAKQPYHFRLEAWNTDPDVLSRVRGGSVMQGAGTRFFEHVDIPAQIKAAAEAAKDADVALVFTGTTAEFESEGYDRETMDLTKEQYDLISAVSHVNAKATVVVNYSGAPVTMTSVVPQVAAILQCWFPGQECGHALAKVLTGAVNPCGRLPMSWPKRIEDNPSFGNFPTDEHDVIKYEEGLDIGYRWYDKPEAPEPLWEFGFGLGYSTFELVEANVGGNKKLSGKEGSVSVSAEVKNTGEKTGKTVVQFYVAPPKNGSVERPVKELKGFKKVEIKAGQSAKTNVELDKYAVSYYNEGKSCWRAEKGEYSVLVGFSAKDIKHTVTFEVTEDFEWTGV